MRTPNAGGRHCCHLALVIRTDAWHGTGARQDLSDENFAPTLNDVPDTFARNYAAALEKDSGGRIKVEVYPASQLGSIPRQIEGTQFGAIQCEVVPPDFMVGLDERFPLFSP